MAFPIFPAPISSAPSSGRTAQHRSRNWLRFPRCFGVFACCVLGIAGALAQQQSPPPNSPPSNSAPPSSPVGAQSPNSTQSVAPQAPANPQSQTGPPAEKSQGGDSGQFVFRKKVEEVVLHAVVIDEQNNLVANLDKSAFRVFEDSKPQEITSFYQEHVPVALGIVIDNSGSMRPKRPAVNDAALNLVRSSNPQDEVFVVNFGEQYYLDQDFTSDIGKLQTALEKIETRGSTALYDAIVASAAHMKQGAELQKRILLVVTDGVDNASQESLEEAIQQLDRKDGPVVYIIALPATTRNAGNANRSLQELSQSTGGAAFFPSDISQVGSITRSIASAIRSQYVIGYKSSSNATGHVYHSVQVQASDSDRHRLRVRTRTGYYSDSGVDSSVPR